MPKSQDSKRTSVFVAELDQNRIAQLLQNVDSTDIDQLTTDIKKIMIDAALTTFGAKKARSQKPSKK